MAEQPGGGGTNWKAMLKDKKLWIGAAVAGGLGLVVFLKRGGSTQGSVGPGGATGATPVGGAGYVQGGADTTGTDIASFLSSYSSALQGQQAEFQGQVKDTITALLEQQGGGATSPNLKPEVYYLESSGATGTPLWGLKKDGQWLTTGSQAQANNWASQYQADKMATFVNQDTWSKLGG